MKNFYDTEIYPVLQQNGYADTDVDYVVLTKETHIDFHSFKEWAKQYSDSLGNMYDSDTHSLRIVLKDTNWLEWSYFFMDNTYHYEFVENPYLIEHTSFSVEMLNARIMSIQSRIRNKQEEMDFKMNNPHYF